MDEIALATGALCWLTIVVVWIGGAIYGAGWNRSAGPGVAVRGRAPLALTVGSVVAAGLVASVGTVALAPLRVTDPAARAAGLAVLLAATAFALSARGALGTSWTVGPRVTGDHELRTTGPYAVTRHPIYSGLLGMLLGTAIAAGGGAALTLPVVGAIVVAAKIRMEEQLLMGAFGDAYAAYRRRTPMLVPRLTQLPGPPGRRG
jgi:protein-S-isoprenylcysteine O-methyltransferase Ste14